LNFLGINIDIGDLMALFCKAFACFLTNNAGANDNNI